MLESVRSLRLGWIGFGWFVAAALTSLLLFVLTVLDLLQPGAPTEGMGVAISLMVGFLIAGFFVGIRVNAAPILHGLAMGLVSVLVWLVLHLFTGAGLPGAVGDTVSGGVMAGLLGLQTAAAVVGARAGVRFARRADALA